MKINLQSNELKLLNGLLETKENNIQISEMMSFLLQNIDRFSKKEISEYAQEYECDEEEAFFHYAIDLWELSYDNPENQRFFKDYLSKSFDKIDQDEYINNQYYKTIKIHEANNKDYHLFYDHYHGYEPFPLDDVIIHNDKNYLEETKFAFFKNDFPFICLNYQKTTWMSITPNEINTMKNSIDHAEGNVLVLGLGLGYFPFMISLKNTVKSIRIVEKDYKIIDIFKKEILPLFPNKNKIQIVQGDAFSYLNNNANKYDFVYVDIYHNPMDGLPTYIKAKQYDNGKFEYWLEEGIIAYLRRLVITILQECLDGLGDKNYLNANNEEDKLINKIYQTIKDRTFHSFNEIKEFLSKDSLINLSKAIKL